MKCIVGIDIGTTNIKVVAFSKNGEPVYSTSRKNKIFNSKYGYEIDIIYIFNKVFEMLQEVVNNIEIVSIGISSFAETVIPIFNKKYNYTRAMVWYDRRTTKQKINFHNKFNGPSFFKITGLRPDYLYSIHKLSWYKQNDQELFNSAYKWLPVNSYIAYMLTGNMGIDYTQACRTGALDVKNRTWSNRIFDYLSFNEKVFPQLINSGQNIGLVKNELTNVLNIDYKIPVALGGHDHICGSYAVTSFKKDVILDSMGTAENIQTVVDTDKINMKNLLKNDINMGAHIIPNMGYIYGTFDYSGALIDHVINLFFNKLKEDITARDYNLFCREAEKYVTKDINVKMYVSQNENKDRYKLDNINLLNISLNTKRGEIFLAAIHYISMKSRNIILSLEKITGKKLKVITIGGSIKNSLLMKEKSKILNRSLYIDDNEEAVTLGAALLGGLSAGIYKDYIDAVKSIDNSNKKIYNGG